VNPTASGWCTGLTVQPGLAGRLLALGVVLACLPGCGGGSDSLTGSSGGVPILLLLNADGPFSVSFQGQTITAQGPYNFTLKPGTYEITGQMRTSVLSVDFSKVTGTGGVQAGSVLSLAGPAVDVSQCGALYLSYSPPSSVRVQFTVTESNGSACKT
jgi:hypothetical protein